MTFLWSVVLVAGGVGLGLTLACIAPFVAVAVLAARTLSPRAAIGVVVATWLGNQLVGFGALHYPRDAGTVAWGVIILATTLLAMAIARRIASIPLALVAGFAVDEVAQFAFAWPTGTAADYAPVVVAQVFAANVVGLAILGALRLAIVALERGTFARGARPTPRS